MTIIKPYTEIMTIIDGDAVLRHVEQCGRICYKSESKIMDDSAKEFVANLIKNGHESALEHYSFSVRFICDRGVSHEIVRHRIASYSQESTRYCSYRGNVAFIAPPFYSEDERDQEYKVWRNAMNNAESYYNILINKGSTPGEARSVLPNSLMTQLVMTANLREWRHFFRLRTAPAAHPQMREITVPLLDKAAELIPVVFDDIRKGVSET